MVLNNFCIPPSPHVNFFNLYMSTTTQNQRFCPLTLTHLLLYDQTVLAASSCSLFSLLCFFYVLAVRSAPIWPSAPPVELPRQATPQPVQPTVVARPELVPKVEAAPVLFPGEHSSLDMSSIKLESQSWKWIYSFPGFTVNVSHDFCISLRLCIVIAFCREKTTAPASEDRGQTIIFQDSASSGRRVCQVACRWT